MRTLAWVGMLGFFAAGTIHLITGSDAIALTALALMLLWCGAGIIEIRRRRRDVQ
jgi:hypothetical protein